ncbi:hypothetical protein PC129_g13680 [Phytophthora cactorum]|nr:hypothetical protein PC129_g13680 [Phytophthora cactorum]
MSVGHLKDAIKAKNTATITCDARNLQLFLANKNGTWLQDNAPLRSELDASYVEISDTWKLENPVLFGPNVSLGENVVHVLVVTPRQPHPARLKRWEKLNELLDGKKKARLNYADELSTVGPTDMAPQPHPARMLRWEKLNELLGRNKKGKPNFADDKPTVASTGDSYISFDDNEEIMRTGRYEQPSKAIANYKIDTLYAYLLVVIRAFGHMMTGKDVKRLYFILPILACVCERFDGEARILTDGAVVGKRVHGEGYFDFIMERGSTRVCVVLVK